MRNHVGTSASFRVTLFSPLWKTFEDSLLGAFSLSVLVLGLTMRRVRFITRCFSVRVRRIVLIFPVESPRKKPIRSHGLLKRLWKAVCRHCASTVSPISMIRTLFWAAFRIPKSNPYPQMKRTTRWRWISGPTTEAWRLN